MLFLLHGHLFFVKRHCSSQFFALIRADLQAEGFNLIGPLCAVKRLDSERFEEVQASVVGSDGLRDTVLRKIRAEFVAVGRVPVAIVVAGGRIPLAILLGSGPVRRAVPAVSKLALWHVLLHDFLELARGLTQRLLLRKGTELAEPMFRV